MLTLLAEFPKEALWAMFKIAPDWMVVVPV
jgi:hypothetical protein